MLNPGSNGLSVIVAGIGLSIVYLVRYYFNNSVMRNSSTLRHATTKVPVLPEYQKVAAGDSLTLPSRPASTATGGSQMEGRAVAEVLVRNRILDGFLFVPVACMLSLLLMSVAFVHALLNHPEIMAAPLDSPLGTTWKILFPILGIGMSFLLCVVLACGGLHFSLLFLQSSRPHRDDTLVIYRRILNGYAAFLLCASIYLVFAVNMI